MYYQIRFLVAASRSFEKLDNSVARKISEKLNWLAENVEGARHVGLRNVLAGQSKLRVGDYRLVYKVFPDEKTIVVRYIEHRSKIYKNE